MLNEREVIEHWHLRDEAAVLVVAMLALLGTAVVLSGLAWLLGIRLLAGLAVAQLIAAAVLGWCLRKVWQRLEKLEEFI